MFTGLISDVGEVLGMERRGDLRRLRIASRYDAASIEVGASIAHAGVCLTIVEIAKEGNRTVHQVDVAAETLSVTNAREWIVGTPLNLERSLRLGDELGGHMVSGHVDGLSEIVARRDFDGMAHFTFRAPPELSRFIAQKGSVALDGTSLTVNAVNGDEFESLLIPHTLAMTSWGARKAADRVNIEVDQMARYAARLLESRGHGGDGR